MEYLDRGLVAIGCDEGVYRSWRLLGTEVYDTAFDVYRGEELIATVSDSTNYVDEDGSPFDEYRVVPAGQVCLDEPVSVLADAALHIPLEAPEGGETPDGEHYDYTAGDATCADLDGDGAYEIVLAWDPTNARDSALTGYTGNVFVDAYRLDGTRLWRLDLGPNIVAGPHYTQLVAYDLDLDGRAEVVLKTAPGSRDGAGAFVTRASADEAIRAADNDVDLRDENGRVLEGDEYLTVFAGDTGEAIDTIWYPHPRGAVVEWGDEVGNRADRFLACVAYLDGVHPSVVVWRGYYAKTTSTALSLVEGRLVEVADFDSSQPGGERFEGLGNHSLAVADVDGDGCDEVLCGCLALDDDLSPLWFSLRGHGDAHHLADYDPTHEGLEYLTSHERGSYGMTLFDAATGEELFHADAGEDTGRCMMANLGIEGGQYELWARELDEMYVFHEDAGTEAIAPRPRPVNFRIFWDGDVYDELLDGCDLDGNCHVEIRDEGTGSIVELPDGQTINGSKNNVCLTADLLGDWREEIVVPSDDGTELLVYVTTIPTTQRLYTPMHDRTYRMQVAAEATGYNQPPHLGYYVSEQPDERDMREDACRVRTVHDGVELVRE